MGAGSYRARLAVGTVVLAASLAGASLAWACSPMIPLRVGAPTVAAGSAVTVSGQFEKGPVEIHLDTMTGPLLGTAPGGSQFGVGVVVPRSTTAGTHVVLAQAMPAGVPFGEPGRVSFNVTAPKPVAPPVSPPVTSANGGGTNATPPAPGATGGTQAGPTPPGGTSAIGTQQASSSPTRPAVPSKAATAAGGAGATAARAAAGGATSAAADQPGGADPAQVAADQGDAIPPLNGPPEDAVPSHRHGQASSTSGPWAVGLGILAAGLAVLFVGLTLALVRQRPALAVTPPSAQTPRS